MISDEEKPHPKKGPQRLKRSPERLQAFNTSEKKKKLKEEKGSLMGSARNSG
jgi:hypothetical protein